MGQWSGREIMSVKFLPSSLLYGGSLQYWGRLSALHVPREDRPRQPTGQVVMQAGPLANDVGGLEQVDHG